jgi:hypothetical protein
MNFFQDFQKGRFSHISFMNRVKLKNDEQASSYMLIISMEYLIYLKRPSKNVVWIVETSKLLKIAKEDDGIKIIVK